MIDKNQVFLHALEILENTNEHVFLTWKAGTGKSTFLSYFRENTKKKVVILAPTWIAALNVWWETIHSFFWWKPHMSIHDIKSNKRQKTLFEKIDMIIIDEVSMVRADILDFVDVALRLNREWKRDVPFWGVQMVFIGDLYQLPPVISRDEKEAFGQLYSSEYFFASHAFSDGGFEMNFIEFDTIYRQEDQAFISLLNNIRNNTADTNDLHILNTRLIAPPDNEDFIITLASTNALADTVNEKHLDAIQEEEWSYTGEMFGEFDNKQLPADKTLVLKKGAQVMFVANDSKSRWVNGTIWKVTWFSVNADGFDEVLVELPNSEIVWVGVYTWEMYHYAFNNEKQKVDSEIIGMFTQFPLRLAWAITIHKSQWKTFDKVIVDIGTGTFAHGQLYVALSRCRSFEWLYLKTRIGKHHIRMDSRVISFVTRYQYKLAEKKMWKEERINFIEWAILEGDDIEMLYLKWKDEKSLRRITPKSIGQMMHLGKSYLWMVAYCHTRWDERVFAVARILEMKRISVK